jgi:uncharacterized protein (TIGR03435 family)
MARLLLASLATSIMVAGQIPARAIADWQETVIRSDAAKFEVASVKACKGQNSGGRGGSGGIGGSDPVRLYLNCRPLRSLIMMAYTVYADDPSILQVVRRPSIEGGPDWINQEFYFVEAKTERNASPAAMRGPMLQALLEQRFHLKVHRETRGIPVYALTVTRKGPKLHPTLAGSCSSAAFDPSGKPRCRSYQVLRGKGLDGRTADWYGMSLDEFVKILPMCGVDRPVINQTGVAGTFDFHLEFAAAGTAPELHRDGGDLADSIAPSVADALQDQLGLKLDPATGPFEFLFIDHVERPTGN